MGRARNDNGKGSAVRVAALADLHFGKASAGMLQPLFAHLAEQADVLVIAGDLTDYGLPDEARALAKELTSVAKLPIVAVLGNHDHESGQEGEVHDILCDAGVNVLDGDSCEVLGVGFAGVKGFAGGFGRASLGHWGEAAIKRFVREALDEALKLESALARLTTPKRVAILHYAPIRATVEGEPPEIYAFLGSSRLEEPFTRYPVDLIVHGHAHHGATEGMTGSGVPVYNVSLPLMRATRGEAAPFRVFELAVQAAEPALAGG